MALKWIPQNQIIQEVNLNPRELDEDHIRTLARNMNENGYDATKPMILYRIKDENGKLVPECENGKFYLTAGFHRLLASVLVDDEFPNLPLPEVYCEIREGTRAKYIRQMLIDNFQHTPGFNKNIGKMPTRKELQQMRFNLLWFPDIFEKGDRLLAREWGCDHKTVSEVRNWFISEIVATKEGGETSPPDHVSQDDVEKILQIIETDLYLGKDGKKYPRTVQTKPKEDKLSESDREARTEAKKKEALFKKMWDFRTEVSSIWVADGDTDLNLYLTVPDLEKAFPEFNSYIADDFKSAMERTKWPSYDHTLKMVLESDVSLDQLEKEVRAMSTYEADVRSWENNGKDASKWIRMMIADRKDRASTIKADIAKSETEQESEKPDEKAKPERRLLVKYYAQIEHFNNTDYPYSYTNELYFPTNEQRDAFIQEFREYHNSHDHDGEPPEIKIVKSADLNASKKSQAKRMISENKQGWATDYDGWYGQELKSKIKYFKPTCIIPEQPEEVSDKEELEKYRELQNQVNAKIYESLFGQLNDNPTGKYNIGRELKREGSYAKDFEQAFLWDNVLDLQPHHTEHLQDAIDVLEDIISDLEIFEQNYPENPGKCKVYLNHLYDKLDKKDEEEEPDISIESEEESEIPKAAETDQTVKITQMHVWYEGSDSGFQTIQGKNIPVELMPDLVKLIKG